MIAATRRAWGFSDQGGDHLLARTEVCGRLVDKDQRWVVHQGSGDRTR
jgi:hypothetical protein